LISYLYNKKAHESISGGKNLLRFLESGILLRNIPLVARFHILRVKRCHRVPSPLNLLRRAELREDNQTIDSVGADDKISAIISSGRDKMIDVLSIKVCVAKMRSSITV